MRTYLISIVFFLLLFGISLAQSLFVSSINFKGQSEGEHFKGREFEIKFREGHFEISQHREKERIFTIKGANNSMLDLVFSSNRSSVAVAMCATDTRNRQSSLVTVDANGKKRIFNYKAYEMTERLGWIVELGSVSNDGTLVLVKCAYMLPENEDGRSDVQHEWIILEINDAEVKILDSIDAIDKWADYARSRM